MKNLTLLLIGLAGCFAVLRGHSETVPARKAEEVARKVILERASVITTPFNLSQPQLINKWGHPLYYLFTPDDNSGFLFLSADDRFPPVLAYSFDGKIFDPGNPPPAFTWFIQQIELQMKEALDRNLSANPLTHSEWTRYSDPGFVPESRIPSVSPLVQTTWDQGCYYNEDCPYDASATSYCYHALTGCGATAMAQIIRFWGAPLHGVGSHTYYHPVYGNLSANFGASTYQYSMMPVSLANNNAEVAQLIYHCGVAQDMDFGVTASTSYANAIDVAFRTYFDYNAAIEWKWRASFTTGQWNSMVTQELDNGRPLIYYGNNNGEGGHFFVCDGYQGTEYMHFNWGWGGYLDGYFYTDDLTPGSSNFTSNQGAIFNIIPNQIPPPPGTVNMDFESVPDFSLAFNPWSVIDGDGSMTYQITNHTFQHSGEQMAYICFNPAQVSPPMTADAGIQPHTGNRFGACFAATTPPNNDWFISPQVQLQTGGEFTFWVKSYTADYGLERYKVGVSTTGTNPGDFTFLSGTMYLEAPVQWTKQTFDLSAFDNQTVYIAIQCVSNDAFIFMIDDLEIKTQGQGGLPTYMTLDFEGVAGFETTFAPWTVEDVNGGTTYGIQNVSFPHSEEAFAYLCFVPDQTTPPLTNMTPHSGSKLGTCFASVPPYNPNNKWLISPQMQFGSNPAISLWVQSYSDQYGLEKYNIGVSTTGNNPDDFTIVNPMVETAPVTWTKKTFNLGAFSNQAVYVGIQCVSDDSFIFMIDDIEISGNVGVSEDEPSSGVNVFPNPARDQVFVTFNGESRADMMAQFLNSVGQVIYSAQLRGPRAEIHTKGLRPGLYYLMITRGDDTFIRKVTIIE